MSRVEPELPGLRLPRVERDPDARPAACRAGVSAIDEVQLSTAIVTLARVAAADRVGVVAHQSELARGNKNG